VKVVEESESEYDMGQYSFSTFQCWFDRGQNIDSSYGENIPFLSKIKTVFLIVLLNRPAVFSSPGKPGV